jgi:hypothetical protein
MRSCASILRVTSHVRSRDTSAPTAAETGNAVQESVLLFLPSIRREAMLYEEVVPWVQGEDKQVI